MAQKYNTYRELLIDIRTLRPKYEGIRTKLRNIKKRTHEESQLLEWVESILAFHNKQDKILQPISIPQ